jgi:T1SS-143 domain-containing protein
MTSNYIVLSQPEDGATLNHEVPTDVSARLNFDPQNIEGLSVGESGELVITFVDGGQVNITNFQELTDNGNSLYLEDGTLVDPSILTTAAKTPQDFNNIETAAGAATNADAIKVAQPAPNTTQEVALEPGQKYVCDFDPAHAALVEIIDGQMVLTFADGSRVIINNYSEVMAGDLPAELTVADGTVIDGEELLTQVTEVEEPAEEELEEAVEEEVVAQIEPAAGEEAMEAVAEALAEVEPAAGEGAPGNSGYGFNSSPTDVPLNSPPAIGPLGPTALQYNAPQVQGESRLIAQAVVDPVPVFNIAPATLDETNLAVGNLTATGDITVSYGGDGPGTITGTGDFAASNEVLGGTLSSGGHTVNVTFDANTNTYTGTANGNVIFTMVIDTTNAEYIYTQYEQFDHADPTNDNEVIFLDFGVSATDNDGDTTTANIRVNVLDDAPVALSQVEQTVDETDMVAGQVSTTGQFHATVGQDEPGTYIGTDTFTATGSLKNGSLTSCGDPVDVTFDANTNTYTGTAGGVTVFTLVLDETTGSYDFTLFQALDHDDTTDPNDSIQLNFGAALRDFDGDLATGPLVVNVLDDAPTATTSSASVDESDATITASGTLAYDFGNDMAATTNPAILNGNVTATGSVAGGTLTSGGVTVDITVSAVPGTSTVTGTANGQTVFTLTLNAATGEYTYTQLLPLDHANGTDPDDIINLTFGVNVNDKDGDSAEATIVINVADDAPTDLDAQSTVDETDLPGPVVVTGTVTPDYGLDGEGSFMTTGDFDSSGSQLNGALTSGGFPVIVTFNAGTNTYTGTANGNDIFTMTINTDGTYSFELLGTLDHADPNNPNDIINLDFGVKATDGDGDTTEDVIRIRVKDDVPTIGDSAGDVDETNFDQGNLVYQDVIDTDFGQDLATVATNGTTSSSTPLTSDNVAVTITHNGTTYTGMAGGTLIFTLEIDPNTGEYVYTQYQPLDHPNTGDHNDVISINFGVSVESVDGDSDTGTITINVADDGPDAVNDINGAEEDQLITGDVLANDILSQDGDDTGDNTVTNVHFDGTDYPVPAGGSVTITGDYGVLIMNSDGTYSYQANDFNPDGTDSFTYTLTDRDGDSDTANLSVRVTPDGDPVAVDETLAVDETNLTPGPMIFNGDLNVNFGQDGAGTVQGNGNFTAGGSLLGGTLTSNNVPVTVTLAGNTYTGTAGGNTIFTLQLNNDGTYTFQLFDHIDHADDTDPNDVITLDFGVNVSDSDGDVAEGTVTIYVHDDAPVAYDDGTTTLDEGQTVNGNVTTNDEFSEDEPNSVVEVIFNGTPTAVPANGTVNVNGQFGVLTIAADGTYSYTANSTNNPDGTDTFTYVLADWEGDRDTAEISFDVNPIDDNPIITPPGTEVVDETNLPGGPLMETGTITVNYGTDGPGEVNPNGTFTSTGSIAGNNLSSCGDPITVTLSGNTYTGTAGGQTVFTMEILENGDYKYTQFRGIDHADTVNHNDAIDLHFGATATDMDGDTADTTVTVRVRDDGPDIGTVTHQVDEDTLVSGNINVSGTVPNDFGGDGAGAITPNGLFQALFQMNGSPVTLSSGGTPITVTTTANGYVGTAGGQTVFQLTINPNTGGYNYQQFDTIDHPDANNPDDVIWLKFYVDIEDCDGDTDTGTIVIDVHDAGPNAVNDTASINNSQNSITGNVLSNDTFGADGPGALTTPGTYNGTYGTLVLNANGTYTYTRNGQAGGTDTFNYTIRDFDGDTDTATLRINVEQDNNPTGISGSGLTDDTNLASGANVETGNISVNYHGDGAGSTTANGNFSAGGSLKAGSLTYQGVPINVTLSGNTYTGSAGGTTVFTMTINANGTFRFVQHQELDHGNFNSHNESIVLNFGVRATDADGDTGNGTVAITVRDDGPNAVNDSNSVGRFATTVSGNVLSNDSYGQDGAGALITPGTYMGNFGRLVLNSNGTYTYTRFTIGGGTDTFNYTIQDGDMDRDTATLTINVTANPPPPPPPPWGDGDGDGGDGGDGCPLVLDLDGDGIELVNRENGVQFDMGADGIMDNTAWVGADDGLLAMDINGDGTINDHSELFGTMEIDGFTVLAQYDSNQDGIVDANDEFWDDILVWRDANQDGVSQEGELFHLSDFGIVGINTNATETDYYVNGQWISHDGTFIYEDGSEGQIVDAWFQHDAVVDNVHVTSGDGSYAAIDGESDLFLFEAIADSAATIENFDTEEGDVVDLSLLIDEGSNVGDAINEFVFLSEEDGNTVISVDVDGADGPAEAVEVARLQGVTGTSLEELSDNGNLVV